jgi:predicted nucleotidyltransferase
LNETRKYGIRVLDLKNIVDILRHNKEIKEAILFGSRAMGNFRNGSDIDIALKGTDLKLNIILNIQLKLDNLNLPYKFDIINYNTIDEERLKEHINRDGINLFTT